MFFNANSILLRLNAELKRSGGTAISRPTFYRIRSLYSAIYPQSQKRTSSGRLVYDDSVALFLYFAYNLTLIYLRGLEQQLQQRGQRFSEAFPSYSAINSYFVNFGHEASA
jgi:hypothetical protein